MSLKIRLARGGAKKRPYYRIVVADARSPRDGRFVEKVGSYNPMLPHDRPERIVLNTDRIKYWLSVGAEPTDRVARFVGAAGLIKVPQINETPLKSTPKKKAQERLKAEEAAEAKKKAAAEDAKKAAAEAAAAPQEPEPLPEPTPEAAIEESVLPVEAVAAPQEPEPLPEPAPEAATEEEESVPPSAAS